MISVEGSIGAGKSTFCAMLKDDDFAVCEEPVTDWILQSKDGTRLNALTAFYHNKTKYASMFQTLVLRTRVEQARVWKGGIVERCIHSDRIFGTMQYRLGHMDEMEYAAYLYQFRQAVRDMPTPVCGYIYIKTSVDTCLDRIAKRNRAGESGITKEYLSLLEEEHESWMSTESNVLVIDGERKFEQRDIDAVVKMFGKNLKKKKS